MGEEPDDKPVEDRAQTEQKLEVMHRYFKAWTAILARSGGQWFCNRHYGSSIPMPAEACT